MPVICSLLLLTFLTIRFWPRPPLSSQVPLSTAVWSADGELLRVTLASDDQYRLWTPLKEMSPELIQAFLLKEDRWFRWHPGVNPVALIRATVKTYSSGRRQGGSTLTMQLARRLQRLNTRTPTGKARQIFAALWLEARYGKRDLLEAYLNTAPFGGNVEGVGAASRIYFGKAPEFVNLGEALTLAVIPQHPSQRGGRVVQEGGLLAARAQLGTAWLANSQANERGESDRRQIELPIVARPEFSLPFLAPHFVNSVLATRGRIPGRVDTTLDAGLQRLLERQINRYLTQFGNRGIRNVSALLVDSRDMGVKAWVGSADFWNEAIDGQVNGVLAKRSPGSTLKPFIYALALDQGVLHPQTILRDEPTAFGPFTPENFDGQFVGPIAAEDALIRSRNVPAMVVAAQVKQPSLYQFLRNAGVSRMAPESFYGLALVLGGGEVTMEELARMYAMLANQGMLRELRTDPDKKAHEGIRLLSPEATFITLDMLTHNRRPDDEGTVPSRMRWPVAWKTGTSWGFRDAWSAGIAGPYVLVVWIGDFDGQGNPSFVGVDAAAPLFFRIVDALNIERSTEDYAGRVPPAGVSRVAVCAQSGELPNAWCSQTLNTWYIPGKSPIRVSDLHRAVALDASGKVACPPYPASVRFEVYEFWSSDMLKLFRRAGLPRRTPPPLPGCASENPADGPRLLSPLRAVIYSLKRESEGDAIELDAAVGAGVQHVFWFDGRALIAKRSVSEGAWSWRPDREGMHLIRVIDDRGRTAERDVQVRFTR